MRGFDHGSCKVRPKHLNLAALPKGFDLSILLWSAPALPASVCKGQVVTLLTQFDGAGLASSLR